MSYHKNIVKKQDINFVSHSNADRLTRGKINVINCWMDNVSINLGTITEEGGKYAYISIDSALQDLKSNKIDALVTAPINKKAMAMANFPYKGHTDYLTAQYPDSNTLMFMVSDEIRVGVVTDHIPLAEVSSTLTKELISNKLETMLQSLKMDFGILKPKVAILGLNPHAGDGGLIGNEDDEIVRPVVVEAKKKGEFVMGPFAADGFFGSGQFTKVDAILAMYHDQGLIPFKTLSFNRGVNFTAGMPIVRTSPSHGTAYEIAGKNEADATSFTKALFLAIDTVRNRKEFKTMKEGAMVKKPKLPQEEQVST